MEGEVGRNVLILYVHVIQCVLYIKNLGVRNLKMKKKLTYKKIKITVPLP